MFAVGGQRKECECERVSLENRRINDSLNVVGFLKAHLRPLNINLRCDQ